MLKVGITGGIGSGKSTVAKIFAVLGIPVFVADREAKAIMNDDEDVIQNVIKLFGNDAYLNGTLNKKLIADAIFKDSFLLEELNAIVHPAVIQKAENWFKKQNAAFALKEAAIMFESGSADHLDFVIGVYAPKSIRIKRVLVREQNLTRDDILKRMDNQIDEEIKMRLCNFVIKNDEQELLIPQVLQLYHHLSELSKKQMPQLD